MSSHPTMRRSARPRDRASRVAADVRRADSGYRELVDGVPIGLYRTLANGTLAEANPALAKVLGYRAAELIGKPVTDLYLRPEDRPELQRLLTEQGDVGRFEVELRRRDGSRCWVRMTSRAVRGADGRIVHYEGAVEDITELRRLARALSESEAQYRMLFERSPEPAWVFDAVDLQFLAVNAAAVSRYGYSREELLSMTVLDIRPADEHARFFDGYGVPGDETRLDSPTLHGVWRHRRKDGSVFLAQVTSDRISFAGRPAYLVVGRDVTDRIRAEAHRERYAQQLKLLAEASIAIDADTGMAGILSTIRDRARELLGAHEVEVVLHGSVDDAAKAMWRIDEAGGDFVAASLRAADGTPLGTIRARGGQSGEVRDANQSILNQLARIASVAIQNARLVAELRGNRERLEAVSRQLVRAQENEQRHVARELHDHIGQMLTALKLMLEATDADIGGAVPASLAEARALVDQLMQQVQGLTLDLRPPALDRLGLLPALLGLLQRFTARTRIEIDFAHRGLERRFSSEIETAAFRIVQEALTNVARHAGVGRAAVTVSAGEQGLSIRVEDRGRGFDLDRVLDNRSAAGLAGMQERATTLGGRVTIDSAPSAGTRVLAELPFGAGEGGERE